MDNSNLIKNKSISIPKIILVFLITLYLIYYLKTISEWHFIDNINLIFHEAGHVVFGLLGNFIGMIGGTLMQILVPIICSFYFYKKEDYFSASLLLFWLSQNLFNVFVYARDAIKMELPLLGGDSVYHDWKSILSTLDILKYTERISSTIYFIGIIILFFAIISSFKFSKNKIKVLA
jgi:DMSO/TMAO reductase YedYZ heme-binding membrane subunit